MLDSNRKVLNCESWANDEAQFAELQTLGELTARACPDAAYQREYGRRISVLIALRSMMQEHATRTDYRDVESL
jgi:hypothetical protein